MKGILNMDIIVFVSCLSPETVFIWEGCKIDFCCCQSLFVIKFIMATPTLEGHICPLKCEPLG